MIGQIIDLVGNVLGIFHSQAGFLDSVKRCRFATACHVGDGLESGIVNSTSAVCYRGAVLDVVKTDIAVLDQIGKPVQANHFVLVIDDRLRGFEGDNRTIDDVFVDGGQGFDCV